MLTHTHAYRLSNDKPSAIFRLRGTFSAQSTDTHAVFTEATTVDPSTLTAILGLSIEPLPQILQELAALPPSTSTSTPALAGGPSAATVTLARANPAADATLLAERVVKHLFNYLSSFVGGNPQGMSPDVMIPLGMVARWYESFVGKVRNSGIGFLERQD